MRGRDRAVAAVAGGGERLPGVLREQERARQEQRDQRVPLVLRELGDRRDVLEARVGHNGVEAAESLERGGDDGAIAFPRREICVGDVDAVHGPAVVLELRDDRCADPAGGAGDERHAAHST